MLFLLLRLFLPGGQLWYFHDDSMHFLQLYRKMGEARGVSRGQQILVSVEITGHVT